MDERARKAFDFASDLAKQLIALSTSVVTVAMLFSDHFPRSGWAKAALMCYLLATLSGIWSLMALTGTIATKSEAFTVDAIYRPNVRIPAAIQVMFFGLATLFTLVFVMCRY
jgi:hypothetical protein